MTRSKRPRSPRPPTVAIVLLVGFIAGVVTFIAFRQIQSAEERRLRLLAGFADRVGTTVPDLADRFTRIVTQRCDDRVRYYLALVPNLQFLGMESGELPCPGAVDPVPTEAAGAPARTQLAGAITLETRGAEVQLFFDRTGGPAQEEDEGVGTDGAARADEPAESWIARTARARIDLDRVIDPMIIPGIFDSVLVTNADGSVLHQQGEPELRIRHLGGLFAADRGDPAAASLADLVAAEGGEAGGRLARLLHGPGRPDSPLREGTATTILETEIANSDYAVFLQPITLRFEPVEELAAPEPVLWIAVGVISSEHLLSAGVTTSPVLLFLLVTFLPLGLITWPFLKLSLISRRQAFTRLDFASLILASILGLSFLALLLVDGLFLTNVRAVVDRQLADLSRVVEQDFLQEVLDAYLQLDHFNAAFPLSTVAPDTGIGSGGLDFFKFVSGLDADLPSEEAANQFISTSVEPILEVHRPRLYPYFDAAFWPDSDGELVARTLPLRDFAVLPQRVIDREYFQCAKDWDAPLTARISLTLSDQEMKRYLARTRPRLGKTPIDASRPPLSGPVKLCLEPLLDRTTGQSVTAVSLPGPDGHRDAYPVAALVAPLTSIHHPVLPAQVHFAVVDASGRVLYHSDTRRALTENFLKATDEDGLLASLIETRREGSLSLHYWGSRHRGYVRPLADFPWTLITFRSMQDVRIRNFELIYDFLNPFLITLGILIALAVVFKSAFPRRFRAYLWPSSGHLKAYRRIVYWTLAVLAAFFYLLANEDLGYTWIFAASVAVIPLSFLYVAWGLRKLHRLLDGEGGGAAGTQLLRDWIRGRRGAVRATKTVRRVRVKIRRWRGTRALRRGLRTAARAAAPIGSWLRSRRNQLRRVPVHLRRWLGVSPENGAKTSPSSTEGKRLARWRIRRRRSLVFLLLLFGAYVVFALVRGVDVLCVFVAGSFFAVLIALDWYRTQFEGEHRRKVAYIFALSCLLLLSLLPSLGFLYLARSRQIQFFTQDAMVALAETVDARQQRLESYQEPLEEEHYESYGGVLACTRDAYLDAFFSGRLQHPGEGTPRCLAPPKGPQFQQERSVRLWPYGWNPLAGDGRTVSEPQQRLRQLRRLLGRIAIQTLSARPIPLNELSPGHAGVDLSRFDTELTAWQRHRDSGGRDWLVFEAPDGPTSEPAMALASEVPNVGSVAAVPTLALGLPVLGLVALGAGPFLFARFIARKLLLISLVYYGKRQPNVSRRELSLQMGPLDPIEEVLAEARREAASQDGLVKRLVLVAGQLHREAWQDFVERGDYHEASFRRSWRRIAAETVPEESHGPEHLPPRARSFGEQLADEAPQGRPILLVDFDPDSSDPVTAADQTAGLRYLMEQRGHAMVILTDIVPLGNPLPELDNRASEAAGYWTELLGAFPVRYARDTRLLDILSSRESEGRKVLVKLEEGRDLPQAEHWHRIVRRIIDECEHTPTLRELGCHLLHEVSVEGELDRVETAARTLTEEIAQLEAVARAEARDVPEDPGAPRGRGVDPARAETEAYEEAARREMASSLRRKQRHKLLLERRQERLETAKGYRSLVTEDHVIGRIGAEARLHYRYLWAQCSTDEKLVLVQLAENGLVNPKYFGWVLDLMNRGLVVRAPDLRIMNRSFESFVGQEVRRSQILRWQEQLGPSAWGVLKWIVPFPLLALAGFLFITQRDAVSNAAGVLVALVSLTPVVFNLYDKFQKVNLRHSQHRVTELEDVE